MAGHLPNFPPFDPEDDTSTTAPRWVSWLDGLETMILAMDINDHRRKWALLRHYAGPKCQQIERQLVYDKEAPFGADDAAYQDHYARLKDAFATYFQPKKNTAHASYIFHSMRQNETETVASFSIRLREQANRAEFCDATCTNRAIRDRIIAGCQSSRLRLKALEDDLALDKLLEIAICQESSKAQAAEIEKEEVADEPVNVNRISKPGKYSKRPKTPNPPTTEKRCYRCGGPFPHKDKKPCPAVGKECSKCQKTGHFAVVCRGGPSSSAFAGAVGDDNDSDNDDFYLSAGLNRVFAINQVASKPILLTLTSSHGELLCNPDTGADVTLIDCDTFRSLRPKPDLQLTSLKLSAYPRGNLIKVDGCFDTTLTCGGKKLKERIYVSNATNKGISLLSREASKALGIVSIHIPINQITAGPAEGSPSHPMLKEFDDICHGVGRHKGPEISLPLKPGAKPIPAPPSRIPVHLLEKVKTELGRLTAAGVFEDVPTDENTQFVSRLVPVPKKIPGTDGVGVRLTMDWRELNRSLDPVHHEVPTVEQLRHDLNGAGIFTELDLKDAFYQFPLDDESRRLTTFSTPWGLKRSTRLVQGAKPSAAICHETLRRDLQGIRGALNIADNILVWGCGSSTNEMQQDHDRALREVFEMFRRQGLTLNVKKCRFNAKFVKFFGFIFSSSGVSPDPEKVAALKEATPPQNKADVNSWLGFVTFNGGFIENFSTISAPIRRLTRKNVKFSWGPAEQHAFDALKKAISKVTLLSYYDVKRSTALFTDASPVGVNATLAQMDDQGRYRPVGIASRALTATEQNYSQIEREAVGMHFGCVRYKLFLQGTHFKHFIDPAPLFHIMNNPKRIAPARIERIRLKLQGFSSEVVLIKGSHNPADYLSRHPLPFNRCPANERQDFADVENHLFVVAKMLPEAITTDKVRRETQTDPTLSTVIELLKKGGSRPPNNSQKPLAPFRTVWSELSVADGLLLRGERMVLPKSLVPLALKIAHDGHMGIQKTKQYLRTALWFPGLDGLVEKEVNNCIPCQATTPAQNKEPLLMTELPEHPWQHLAADIFGPLPSGQKVLVVKCLRSKWPEVAVFSSTESTNANGIIKAMKRIFTTHGVPETVRTDNGPPFNSKEFKAFSAEVGFETQKVTPLWPQANGQAEAFMKCLGKVVRTAHIENKDWRPELDSFLMAYRATPHPSTGMTPAQLLFPGRQFKTRLPSAPKRSNVHTADTFNRQAMLRAKTYADARSHAKPIPLQVGDNVLVKQRRVNKLSPYFNPKPYTVVSRKGSMVTVCQNGHRLTRNASFFKKVNASGTPPKQPLPSNHVRQTTAAVPLPIFGNDPPIPAVPGAAPRQPAFVNGDDPINENVPAVPDAQEIPPPAANDPELLPVPVTENLPNLSAAAEPVPSNSSASEGSERRMGLLRPRDDLNLRPSNFSLPRNIRFSVRPSELTGRAEERRSGRDQ